MYQTPQEAPRPTGPPIQTFTRPNVQTQPIPQRQPTMNIAGSPAPSKMFQPQMQTPMFTSNENAPYMPQQGVVLQTGMPTMQGYQRAQLSQLQMTASLAQYHPMVNQPTADQLRSVSHEGRRQYDRMFLLSLRYVTASMIKPTGLSASDVLLKEPLKPSNQLFDGVPNLYPAGYAKPLKMGKDNILSFLSPAKSNSYSEVFHKMIVEQNKDNDEIFDWIFNNLPSSVHVNPDFVRTLMQSVCISALKEIIDDIVTWELMEDKLVRRVKVLRKFLTKADLELQALYALQAIMQRLGHPTGLLQQFFDVLYDEVVISEDCFYTWEKDNNPNEAGKKQARKTVVKFFSWLKAEEKHEGVIPTAFNVKDSKTASYVGVWVSQQQTLSGTRPKTISQTRPGPGPFFSLGTSGSTNARRGRNYRRRKNQRKKEMGRRNGPIQKDVNVNDPGT